MPVDRLPGDMVLRDILSLQWATICFMFYVLFIDQIDSIYASLFDIKAASSQRRAIFGLRRGGTKIDIDAVARLDDGWSDLEPKWLWMHLLLFESYVWNLDSFLI
jgi:hypothetical protein